MIGERTSTDTGFFFSSSLRPGEINNGGMSDVCGCLTVDGCDVFAVVFCSPCAYRADLRSGLRLRPCRNVSRWRRGQETLCGSLVFGFRMDVAPARAAPPRALTALWGREGFARTGRGRAARQEEKPWH